MLKDIQIFAKSVRRLLRESDDIRALKSIYYNFKLFPLHQAICCPLFLYGDVRFNIAGGTISLKPSYLSSGLLKIGCFKSQTWGNHPICSTIVNLKGTWNVYGAFMLSNGSLLTIAKGAIFETQHDVSIGPQSKVVCTSGIKLGRRLLASWDVQIFDTNFHFVIKDDVIKKREESVEIGDCCWIGNRVTISKGVRITNGSIVASNSLVNKNYPDAQENSLYCGMPAVCRSLNITRFSISTETENKVADYFTKRKIEYVSVEDADFKDLYIEKLN